MTRETKYTEFIQAAHKEQVRKYTGEPYFNHLTNVANTSVAFMGKPLVFEIALGHDVLEDVPWVTPQELLTVLYIIGYSKEEAAFILSHIQDLTDEYTPIKYPYINRAERKEREAIRLGRVPALSQSIKCADLADNTRSIVEHDPKFAGIYIK